MKVSFNSLIAIYRQSKPVSDSNGKERLFCIQSNEDLEILLALSSDEHCENTNLSFVGNAVVGETVVLSFGAPKLQFGRFFETWEDFIKGDMAHFNTLISQSPYFIKSKNWASFDDDNPTLKSYQTIVKFLLQLAKMCSYEDKGNKKFIFFSKKTFELSIDIRGQIDSLITTIQEISTNTEKHKLISDFQQWLDDEETNSHLDEKKSILAFVLSDFLRQGDDFIFLIQNIKHISKAVQAQYALYLENFSYEKFVKKLEENTENFVSRINETVGKVLPQFLGLPFLTAIPSALKSADDWLVYCALIVYCFMCAFGLTNQKLVLDHITQDIEKFEDRGQVPERLKSQWDWDRKRIDKLLKMQYKLY